MPDHGYDLGGSYAEDSDYLDCIADAEEAWHAARDEYAERVASWSSISFSEALAYLHNRLP